MYKLVQTNIQAHKYLLTLTQSPIYTMIAHAKREHEHTCSHKLTHTNILANKSEDPFQTEDKAITITKPQVCCKHSISNRDWTAFCTHQIWRVLEKHSNGSKVAHY